MALGPLRPVQPSSTLVLGTATNFAVDDVKAFVLSLRAHYAGPACIFIDRGNRPLRSFLEAQGVEAPIVEDLPFRFGARVELVRYAYFLWYLRQAPTLPGAVLLIDTRDVLFQADPFDPPPGELLHYFVETNDIPLRRHTTGRWIGWTFNRGIADLLAAKPCICSGTIIGRGDRVVSLLTTILSLAAIPRFAQARSFGIDQAIVNYIAHFDLLGPTTINRNFGTVATIGLVAPRDLAFDGATIVNPDGTMSPIVHQYDRHPLLWQAVLERYRLGMTNRMREAEDDKRRAIGRRVRHWGWAMARRIPELR